MLERFVRYVDLVSAFVGIGSVAAMTFTFDGFSDDWWTFGFCTAGELGEWREKGRDDHAN